MQRSLIVSIVLTLAITTLGAAACADLTPITADTATEAGAMDVSVAATDASAACLECSSGEHETGATCSSAYAACSADHKCFAMFMCGLGRDCYAPGTNIVDCLTTCGSAAGLTGAADPSIAPFVQLYTCATSTCASACSR